MNVEAPHIEYGQLAPLLIILGVAVAGILVEAFVPRRHRYGTQLVLALGGQIAALVAVVSVTAGLGSSPGNSAAVGSLAVDRPALFLQGLLLLIGILGVLLAAERRIPASAGGGLDGFTPQAAAVPGSVAEKVAAKAVVAQTEIFPLMMLALAGMMIFGAADDLLTMFVALEVLSLPLYLMCGLARRRRLVSQEAALKYFLLGAFASAFFLYGIALLYGYAGGFGLDDIATAIAGNGPHPAGGPALALAGAGLLAVGILFKVGAVPFHSWIPDVYQGAPTPVTAFMAAATKIAAFGAMLRIFYVALPGLAADWRPMMWIIAIVTMVVGTLTAVTQSDVKRMLAYSAVAHTGFILTGVIALDDAGVSATLFYLFAYGFSTLGAFALAGLVRRADGEEETALAQWAGLGRRYPVVGVVFSLFLLAFAGIPLTSGFVSKFAVFKAAAQGGGGALVIIGVIASAVAAYFYVRVIVLMFFTDPPADAPEVVAPSVFTTGAVTVTAAVTFALGALPQPLLDLVNDAQQFVR